MNKIQSFLSSYEEELQLQVDFFDKSIQRVESQVKDAKKSINTAKKSIDTTYNLFSASQSNNEVETEIDTLNQIIVDKNNQIADLKKQKEEIVKKLTEVKELDYTKENCCADVDLIDKLILIRKYMDIDMHRAKIELDQIISKVTQ